MPKGTLNAINAWKMYLSGRSVSGIARYYSVSRIAVWKAWKKMGYETSGFRVQRACEWCGSVVLQRRNRALNAKRAFCTQEHYLEWVKARGESYRPWRQGQRRAHAAVASYVQLQAGNVVHHHDGDNRNNRIDNLAVFATQADHMSYERGGDAKPIWDGYTIHALEAEH